MLRLLRKMDSWTEATCRRFGITLSLYSEKLSTIVYLRSPFIVLPHFSIITLRTHPCIRTSLYPKSRVSVKGQNKSIVYGFLYLCLSMPDFTFEYSLDPAKTSFQLLPKYGAASTSHVLPGSGRVPLSQ